MKLKNIIAVTGLFLGAFCGGTASAAAVTCGQAPGLRITVVDPALVGGYCYAQNGNLQTTDIANLGLTYLSKQTQTAFELGTVGTFRITSNPFGSDTYSGNWTISASAPYLNPWDFYKNVYIGFHFGGGGVSDASNPDSFILQLSPVDLTGTWELTGTNAEQVKLGGLSNIYLLASGRCTDGVPCVRDPQEDVPEPASLALVGLGLVAAVAARRRRHT